MKKKKNKKINICLIALLFFYQYKSIYYDIYIYICSCSPITYAHAMFMLSSCYVHAMFCLCSDLCSCYTLAKIIKKKK